MYVRVYECVCRTLTFGPEADKGTYFGLSGAQRKLIYSF